MEQGFLERESEQGNRRRRKLFLISLLVYTCLISFIIFALKDSLDLSDYTSRKLVASLAVLTGIMLVCSVAGLAGCIRPAVKGKNLILPFKENTKEEVGKIIDREVAEGKVLVEEYIEKFPEGKKPHGERLILTPSYLLLCNGMGRVKAIPRDRIYWLCAQVGIKGGPFIVRVLIFTEKQTFDMTGGDIEYVEEIADKLYRYIPNVFSEYDPFALSYELERLFDKDRETFLQFYEEEKKKALKNIGNCSGRRENMDRNGRQARL